MSISKLSKKIRTASIERSSISSRMTELEVNMSKYPHHLDHWLMESEWTILAIQHVKLTDKIDALIRRRQRIIKRRNLLKNLFRR